jgi:putative ABC transport system ATP-binding protein
MDLLQSLAKEHGRGVVVVTHDHRLERYADRVVRVEDGRVVSDEMTNRQAA